MIFFYNISRRGKITVISTSKLQVLIFIVNLGGYLNDVLFLVRYVSGIEYQKIPLALFHLLPKSNEDLIQVRQ
jgi:hypothetical protein